MFFFLPMELNDRSRRSVGIDLKSEPGIKVSLRLIDQDDALVALAHRRQIGLDDDGFAVEPVEHLEERVEVL